MALENGGGLTMAITYQLVGWGEGRKVGVCCFHSTEP